VSGGPVIRALARERRHTLYFLESIRSFSPVFIDTEIDASALYAHRSAAETRCSVVAYTVAAAGRALARHPEANAAIRGRVTPRIARYPDVHAKVTLDKTVNGERVVLAAVLRDVDRTDLEGIQRELERYRDGDPERLEEFAGVRLLHRLPVALGRALTRRVVGPLGGRPDRMGTFAVTSLGHRPVDGFYSVGGTTITLGIGRVTERPVVRDGEVVVAPVLRLSLAFDHRVIDGAEAADVLADIKDALENIDVVLGADPRSPARG